MVDVGAVDSAVRSRLLSGFQAATTGSISLAATTSGYTRASGSFLSDGFRVGMEFTPAGFTANTVNVVTSVSALALGASGVAAEAEAPGRSLTAGLPAKRAWENEVFEPTASPYVHLRLNPGAVKQYTTGPLGIIEALFIAWVSVYVRKDVGSYAAHRYATALLGHFRPNLALSAPGSDTLSVSGDPAPRAHQLVYAEASNHAVVPVSVPLRLITTNSV